MPVSSVNIQPQFHSMEEQSVDPPTQANTGYYYSKDVAGNTEGFYKDSSGSIVQITSGGSLLVPPGGGGLAAVLAADPNPGGLSMGVAEGTTASPGLYSELNTQTGFRFKSGGWDFHDLSTISRMSWASGQLQLSQVKGIITNGNGNLAVQSISTGPLVLGDGTLLNQIQLRSGRAQHTAINPHAAGSTLIGHTFRNGDINTTAADTVDVSGFDVRIRRSYTLTSISTGEEDGALFVTHRNLSNFSNGPAAFPNTGLGSHIRCVTTTGLVTVPDVVKFEVDGQGNVGVQLDAQPGLAATTDAQSCLHFGDGIAPVGALTAGGALLYAASGELHAFDAAGNDTLLSPHDEEGNWVYHSKREGRALTIEMEKLMVALNDFLGTNYVHERVV